MEMILEIAMLIVPIGMIIMVAIFSVATIINWMHFKVTNSIRTRMLLNKNEMDRNTQNIYRLKLKYSKEVLDFIKSFVLNFTASKYKTFKDNTYIDKITKTNLENFIEETANEINEAIQYENIDFDNLLYTREYINTYIIDICIYVIKELFHKSIDDEAIDVIDQ